MDLSFCLDITDRCMLKMAERFRNLETINLSGCPRVTDETVDIMCVGSWCARPCAGTSAHTARFSIT